MSRPIETSDLFLEELTAEIGLDDSIPIEIDDRNYDSEGDIIFFEQLLNEDTSSDVSPALLPTKSSSLDLPLPDPKQLSLREVERFDPFFSLTRLGGKTRVMETPSFGFHRMPSPRPAAYSPREVQGIDEVVVAGRENLMEAIQAFLKKYDQIPPKEKSMALLLAEERFLKIKQALEEEHNQPEDIQELLLKLINNLQILNGIQLKQEEQAAKVSSQYWKPPIFYDDGDDDDEESSISLRDIISELPLSVAIAPDLTIMNSLIMEDEHLNTILETESDEENKSSVKDLNNPK
ncbi:hypothetical protein Tco_0550234 [Tanacetum coccineum]